MENLRLLLPVMLLLSAVSCTQNAAFELEKKMEDDVVFSRRDLARIFSQLPLGEDQLYEVYDAVCCSSQNGYDEEYMMADLLSCPGAGVGDKSSKTKAEGYSLPIRDMFTQYLEERYSTKAGGAEKVEEYLRDLEESDLQIYWPYSEDWSGTEYPVITFDPGYGAESNYGYVLGPDRTVTDSLLVTEEVAKTRPVWVINSNTDSGFTPLDFYTKASSSSETGTQLLIKDFTMLRNFDSWFGGASEFFIKFGAVDGFKATSDDDLKLYYPSVTDFMIVVKRKYVGKKVPFEALLLSNFTSQMEKFAFLVVEDDGGTTTSWKCSATVKYNSKSYGFDIEIPYKDKDDIVWRGQLDASYFADDEEVTGRFGDVMITFEKRR